MTTVLLLYDWVITFPREVQMFWIGNTGTLSTFLYFTNRFVSLSVAGVRVLTLAAVSNKVRHCPVSTRMRIADHALSCYPTRCEVLLQGSCSFALTVGVRSCTGINIATLSMKCVLNVPPAGKH